MGIPRHRLAVAVMVVSGNKILLVKERRRGWEFPGGYVEEGESIKQAAIREVKEESGIDIQLTRFCGIQQVVARSTCVLLFAGKPVGGKLSVSNESLDVGYFNLNEAIRKMSGKTLKDRINQCLKEGEPAFAVEI